MHWLGLWTLIRREMSRYFKEWLETVVAPVFSTLLYLVVFAAALGPGRRTAEGEAALEFMLPGLVLYAVMTRACETPVFSLAYDRMERIISDILMPPLSPTEITLAYVVAGTASGLITGVPVLLAVMLAFGLPVAAPLLAAVFAVLAALMLALFGLLIGLWTEKWDQAAAVFTFLLMPLTFLSGTFAPVEAMPGPLAAAMRLNPVFYAIDGFRAGFLGDPSAPVGLGLAVLGGTVLGLWLLSDRLIRRGYKLKP